MKITLNLATRPFTDLVPMLKRLRIGMAVLAGLSLLLLLGLHLFGSQAAAARAREHSLDGQLARVQAERQQAQAFMAEPANAQLLRQTQFLNDRFDEKAFSWTLAMQAMETVLPAGVAVTAIEPQRTKEGNINVEIRVVGPHDQSVDLVRNLEKSHRFISPRIENESAESSNTMNQRQMQPVSASNRFEFELFADYNPPTAAERAALERHTGQTAADRAANRSQQRSQQRSGAAAATPWYVPHAHPAPLAPNGHSRSTGPAQLWRKPSLSVYGGPR